MEPLLLWLAGTDATTAQQHSGPAQRLAKAIAMTLLVTGGIAAVGMYFYAWALTPEGWPVAARIACAVLAALLWMILILVVDRSLLLAADAVDSTPFRAFMLVVRLTLAFALSFLVSHMILLARYSGPVADMAWQMSLERRKVDTDQLATLYHLPGLGGQVKDLSTQRAEVTALREILPESTRMAFASADYCDREVIEQNARVERLVKRIRAIKNASDDVPEWLMQSLSSNRTVLRDLRTKCGNLRLLAEKERSDYFSKMDGQLAALLESQKKANGELTRASEKFAEESRERGVAVTAWYADASARDRAFAKVLAQDDEVAKTALITQIALLIIELLPFLIKASASNNPISTSARTTLAQECGHSRKLLNSARIEELSWKQALQTPDASAALVAMAAVTAEASAMFDQHDYLVGRMIASGRSTETAARTVPSQTGTIHASYAETVKQAFTRAAEGFAT